MSASCVVVATTRGPPSPVSSSPDPQAARPIASASAQARARRSRMAADSIKNDSHEQKGPRSPQGCGSPSASSPRRALRAHRRGVRLQAQRRAGGSEPRQRRRRPVRRDRGRRRESRRKRSRRGDDGRRLLRRGASHEAHVRAAVGSTGRQRDRRQDTIDRRDDRGPPGRGAVTRELRWRPFGMLSGTGDRDVNPVHSPSRTAAAPATPASSWLYAASSTVRRARLAFAPLEARSSLVSAQVNSSAEASRSAPDVPGHLMPRSSSRRELPGSLRSTSSYRRGQSSHVTVKPTIATSRASPAPHDRGRGRAPPVPSSPRASGDDTASTSGSPGRHRRSLPAARTLGEEVQLQL